MSPPLVHHLLFLSFRLNVTDIQETCQKNAASALTVGRKDLLQVLLLAQRGISYRFAILSGEHLDLGSSREWANGPA